MKVAVYSGSFNPMHVGHLQVVRYLLDQAGYDMVYLIVSPHNPFKDAGIADNSRERYLAACEAIERNGLQDRVMVDDIEFGMSQPSYSIRTLDALKAREPRCRFTLVIGADNLGEMLRWKEGARLMSEYGIAVYPREGFNMVHDCSVLKRKHKNAEMVFEGKESAGETGAVSGQKKSPKSSILHIKLLRDAPLVTVSSTQIRQMIARGEDVSSMLA